jgi:hypothetical protein
VLLRLVVRAPEDGEPLDRLRGLVAALELLEPPLGLPEAGPSM